MDEVEVENPEAVAAAMESSREDRRPKIPEPPPVTLVSVGNVRLPLIAGLEREADAFYVDLLRFVRLEAWPGQQGPAYRAENHDLRLVTIERPAQPDGARPIRVATPFFGEIIERLQADKIEHEHARGLIAGTDGVLLQDPSGNWVALVPRREIR